MSTFHLVDHPLIQHKLTFLRNEKTTSKKKWFLFLELIARIELATYRLRICCSTN